MPTSNRYHNSLPCLSKVARKRLTISSSPYRNAGRLHLNCSRSLFERAIPKSFNTAGPGYLAYIPGGGLFHTAVADLITGAVNRYMGLWIAAPALAQIEATVIRWFCDLVGYPASARGILTTGGSLANFSAVVTARRERLPENFFLGRFTSPIKPITQYKRQRCWLGSPRPMFARFQWTLSFVFVLTSWSSRWRRTATLASHPF